MPLVHVNGVNIHYEEVGSGTPLIFSHEFAGSWESWEAQMSHFARRYRVVAYNNRGYPPSDVPEDAEAYSEEQSVDDLRALLDALGIERAFLCGLSMGGGIVLKFGMAHPERCLGLVVAGAGSGSVSRAEFEAGMNALLEVFDRGDMDTALRYTATGATRVQFARKDPLGMARFSELFLQHSSAGSAHTLRQVQIKRRTILQVEDELVNLNLPVLVLVGDEDAPCIAPALLMKQRIPNCGLMIFPKSGHAINLEEPQLFNDAVQRFITDVESGAW
jgi:pimeloyl-ACP methyl ester carboxylesterase